MKHIAWVFWGFLALLTGLWLMADTLLPAQRGYFDFRTVWVQYTGVIAMGVMSLAMAAGGAPGVAGAAPRRPGQDVPPAQVAGHWRAGGGHGALAVSQGHQVGRGLGLADQAGAVRAAARRSWAPSKPRCAAGAARPR